jgi:hypothetical protein
MRYILSATCSLKGTVYNFDHANGRNYDVRGTTKQYAVYLISLHACSPSGKPGYSGLFTGVNLTRTQISLLPLVNERGSRNSSSRKRRFEVLTSCSAAPSSSFGFEYMDVFEPAKFQLSGWEICSQVSDEAKRQCCRGGGEA